MGFIGIWNYILAQKIESTNLDNFKTGYGRQPEIKNPVVYHPCPESPVENFAHIPSVYHTQYQTGIALEHQSKLGISRIDITDQAFARQSENQKIKDCGGGDFGLFKIIHRKMVKRLSAKIRDFRHV